MEIGEKRVFQKTIDIFLAEHHKSFEGEEEFKETWDRVRALTLKGTVKDLVSSCIEASWDLPAFAEWILKTEICPEDAKALLGEAAYRMNEWDT